MVQPNLPNQILHFTSCNVLESIIKDDGLHFWASRYDCMNDSLEYRWLYEPLEKKIVRDNPTLQGQVDSLYEIFPYVVSFRVHLIINIFGKNMVKMEMGCAWL